MKVDGRTFWLPKTGHRPEEYEDAAAGPVYGDAGVRAAVADGATETAYARVWAQSLVRTFVQDSAAPADYCLERLGEARRQWAQQVEARRDALPWYLALKADQGAYAAFLGIELRSDRTWQAVSIGDCCLFQVRDGACVLSWPYTRPEAFTHHPELVRSRPQVMEPEPVVYEGRFEPQDTFLLATDTLAAGLLAGSIDVLGAVASDDFNAVIASKKIRNDDLTLVRLRVEEEEP